MASVFTFPHEPPRVSSPWRSGQDAGKRPNNERSVSAGATADSEPTSDSEVERLEAEPQDGPIEYKLHLLLRPRRTYKMMSTAPSAAGYRTNRKLKEARQAKQPVLLTSSNHSRQNRLHHLTTQLLWRLKQSSPEHATARGDLIIPKLPEDTAELIILQEPAQLLPGLEESNGALYEIGVADDGTFVGLTKEEMDESMMTLKVMAASLGCRVEVQRMKAVGTCGWLENPEKPDSRLRHEDLWVAEALIVPILDGGNRIMADDDTLAANSAPRRGASTTEQLRVSLTGPTTSGKTTLLGTLANGTLDDGRGRSRSYLLKHRHEVVSGRTSSVAQELIGYEGENILNYTCMDIKAWPDIHDRAQDGRLVFLLDSAGHPRYQRTTLRALVGWAPHWTLLCIAASEENTISTGTHSLIGVDGALGIAIAEMDLAMAHLDLCLRLEIPLAILITKIEKAQRTLLKEKLNSILTKVKATGRTPKLLTGAGPLTANSSRVPDQDRAKVQTEVIDAIAQAGDPLAIVPIVLTSAITGIGIGLTHALLGSLPVPPMPTAQDFVPLALNPEQPAALFHIDEVFELARSRTQSTLDQTCNESAPVVTGYLRFGRLSIGDNVVLGPFPAEDEDVGALVPNDHPSPGYGLSIPHPASAEYARLSARNALSASKIEGEWRNATIVNIRELRLPVQSIEAGQAGSIQVVFDGPYEDTRGAAEKRSNPAPRIRKGQVLAMPSRHMIETELSLQASTGFKASFMTSDIQSLTVGSLINAYVGMVRAAVRVLRVSRQISPSDPRRMASEDDDIFGMGDRFELERTKSETDLDLYSAEYHVSLELLSNREWIELGSRVVLIEGGIKVKSGGLDGFVGKVIEITE
ncbi:putative GTP-binding protein [Rosellinia necatrix]|uniref:Putative GTP-binding protein n=1 Tax=Rosellinia necatrix TaxID=77044 RepID=A0A1S7UKM7_ROSNE|nr:putative GTP-binding protein [Rosellinia necatrix]